MATELEKLKDNTLRLIEEFEMACVRTIKIYEHNAMLVKIIRKYIPHKTITELIDEYKRDTGSSTGGSG